MRCPPWDGISAPPLLGSLVPTATEAGSDRLRRLGGEGHRIAAAPAKIGSIIVIFLLIMASDTIAAGVAAVPTPQTVQYIIIQSVREHFIFPPAFWEAYAYATQAVCAPAPGAAAPVVAAPAGAQAVLPAQAESCANLQVAR